MFINQIKYLYHLISERVFNFLLIVRSLLTLIFCCVQRKIPAKHKAKNSKDDDEPIIYPKLEDEIFNEVSKHAIQKLVVSVIDANEIFSSSA